MLAKTAFRSSEKRVAPILAAPSGITRKISLGDVKSGRTALTSEDERASHNPNSFTRSYFEIKGVYYSFKQGRDLDVQQLGIRAVFNRKGNQVEWAIHLSTNEETKAEDDSTPDGPISRPHVFHHLAHDAPVLPSLLLNRDFLYGI